MERDLRRGDVIADDSGSAHLERVDTHLARSGNGEGQAGAP